MKYRIRLFTSANSIPAIIVFCILAASLRLHAQAPLFGGEVWIEPGQTESQVDDIFRRMKENHMVIARVFIMWNQVETQPGVFDFTPYDLAFRSAEKHGIKISATLTPAEPPPFYNVRSLYLLHQHTHIEDRSEYPMAANYISRTVKRYKNNPALEYWWLTNEPGQGTKPSPLAIEQFRKWLNGKYKSVDALNSAWMTSFKDFDSITYAPCWDKSGGWRDGWASPMCFMDWHMFWRDFLVSFLEWIAGEVRKNDSRHPLTVNPQSMHELWQVYDFPKIRAMTSALGTSMHPSWVLTDYGRDKFGFGVAESNDLLRGRVNENEFWMSELQAGPNTFSGRKPVCPDSRDLEQWVWISISGGAKRIIYWLINPRTHGGEAGEWSLFSYSLGASERSEASRSIAEVVDKYRDLFENAHQIDSGITLIRTPQSQFFLDCYANSNPAFDNKVLIKSLSAWHQMFMRLGLSVQMLEAGEYQWTSASTGRVAILPNALVIPSALEKPIYEFVGRGNTLIADGQSFTYDENINNLFCYGSPFEELFGARLKDVIMQVQPDVRIKMPEPGITLKASSYRSELIPTSAKVLSGDKTISYATCNSYKSGKAVWIPQQLRVREFETHDINFAKLVFNEVKSIWDKYPVVLDNLEKDVLLQSLVSGDRYLSVVSNCSSNIVRTKIICRKDLAPRIIWGNAKALDRNGRLKLNDRETIVIIWEPFSGRNQSSASLATPPEGESTRKRFRPSGEAESAKPDKSGAPLVTDWGLGGGFACDLLSPGWIGGAVSTCIIRCGT